MTAPILVAMPGQEPELLEVLFVLDGTKALKERAASGDIVRYAHKRVEGSARALLRVAVQQLQDRAPVTSQEQRQTARHGWFTPHHQRGCQAKGEKRNAAWIAGTPSGTCPRTTLSQTRALRN